MNYKNNNNSMTNNARFKINVYTMLQGNICIAEPKLEVLPFS